MESKKYIAVYGSLRQGMQAAAMMEREGLMFVGNGTIQAKLYDLGWYPGIQLSTDPTAITQVDVYEVAHEDELNHLHRYEGYEPKNPERSLFILRREVPLLNDDRKVMCYEYNFGNAHNEAPNRPVVEDGDWPRYVSERNSRNAIARRMAQDA